MKSLFIHSLSRAGSTMFECLIDSQEDMACFRYLFRLPELHKVSRFDLYQGKPAGDPEADQHFLDMKRVMIGEYAHFLSVVSGDNDYIEDGMEIGSDTLVSGIPIKKIIEGSRFIALAKTMDELLDVEQKLGEFFGLKVLAYGSRLGYLTAPGHLKKDNSYWTEIVSFWLEKKNSYWIDLIRNPHDRLTSAMIMAPQGKVTEMFEETHANFQFVSQFKHERFLAVKYEDLCADTEGELQRISEFLGETLNNVPLLNYYGRPFYPNTSKSVLAGKSYMHQDKKLSSRIGGMKSNRWSDRISPAFAAAVNQHVHTNGLYETMPVSALARLKGKIWFGRFILREKLRQLIIRFFKSLGFKISKA